MPRLCQPPGSPTKTPQIRVPGRPHRYPAYCFWHHHVLLHQLGWTLTVHPDGTSQVTSPDGKTIRSHSPPPRPG